MRRRALPLERMHGSRGDGRRDAVLGEDVVVGVAGGRLRVRVYAMAQQRERGRIVQRRRRARAQQLRLRARQEARVLRRGAALVPRDLPGGLPPWACSLCAAWCKPPWRGITACACMVVRS